MEFFVPTCATRSFVLARLVVLACALMPLLSFVMASCPTNGNTHAVYVTSNMGDNIWSFDTQGTFIGDVINRNSFPSDVKVSKLRAMRFGPDGYLYISSARGAYSQIFAVSGNGVVNGTMNTGCTRNYSFTVVRQDATNLLLDHPYDIVFHPETNDLFVANQNSITITKYRYMAGSTKHTDYPSWQPIKNIPGTLTRVTGNDAQITNDERDAKRKHGKEKDQGNAKAADSTRMRTSDADNDGVTGGKTTALSKSSTIDTAGSLVLDGALQSNDQQDVSDDNASSATARTVSLRSLSAHAGLFASSWSDRYALTSVRGIALSPKLPRSLVMGMVSSASSDADGVSQANAALAREWEIYLLVCDVAANAVHVFHSESGEWLFDLSVSSPIQVVFPARYSSTAAGSETRTSESASSNPTADMETPYVYVTSKEDATVYLVRFAHPRNTGMELTSRVSSSVRPSHGKYRGRTYLSNSPSGPAGIVTEREGVDAANVGGGGDGTEYNRHNDVVKEIVANGDVHHTPKRLYEVTSSINMHSASGLYENAAHGTLFVADRVGRTIVTYASPFLSEQSNRAAGPSAFLGYFSKQLPDQPEFITNVLLESQANIPFCYELESSGSLRYSALCLAANLWLGVFLLIAMTLFIFFVYRALRRWCNPRTLWCSNSGRLSDEGAEQKGIYEPLLANDANSSNTNTHNDSNGRNGYGSTQ